jgi:parallel beta-helix repeat protein
MFRHRQAGSFLFRLVMGLILCAPGASRAATTYYVSPTGSDQNNGSQNAPFRQIRAALPHLQPADTLLISDGSYLGFTADSLHGQDGAPITFRATGSNVLVTPTTDRPDNRDTIFLTFCSYLVLEGLRSFNANRAAIRIDNSPHITVRGGVYGNNSTWGIFTDFSDSLLLENNDCYGSQTQHGIYVSNSCVHPTIRGNRLHDNYAVGLHMNGDLSQGGTGLITGALVENNLVYNNGLGGGAGINMDGVQHSLIRNNLLYNNHASGITMYQIDGAQGPQGNQVLNNTVDMASDARWALLISGSSGPNTVRNNILYDRNPSHGGLLYAGSADVTNTDSDANILDWISTDDGSSRLSLAQWQAQGHEIHSLSATPASLFVNPASGDYHLLATAPAIDRGETLLDVTTDLEGNARPSGAAFDIGCYEYVSRIPFDFNGDGKSDLVWQNQTTGDATFWAMNTGAWSGNWSYLARSIPSDWKIVAAPDLNGDGRPDLVWMNQTTGDVTYWIMNGTQWTGNWGYIAHNVSTAWRLVTAADLFGNGSVSLVWQNQATGDVTYWVMNGAQWTGNWGYIAHNVSTAWKIVGSGDLTGDGKADLVWQNQTTGDVSYWEISDGTWTGNWGYIAHNVSTAWKIEAILDLSGDGKPDLIWRNQATGDVTYWVMNGTQWTGNWGYIAHNVSTAWKIVGVH